MKKKTKGPFLYARKAPPRGFQLPAPSAWINFGSTKDVCVLFDMPKIDMEAAAVLLRNILLNHFPLRDDREWVVVVLKDHPYDSGLSEKAKAIETDLKMALAHHDITEVFQKLEEFERAVAPLGDKTK